MAQRSRGMVFVDFDNISIPAYRTYHIRRINFAGLKNVLLTDISGVGTTVYLPDRLKSFIYPIQKAGLDVKIVSPR